jgi:hypothetical protein
MDLSDLATRHLANERKRAGYRLVAEAPALEGGPDGKSFVRDVVALQPAHLLAEGVHALDEPRESRTPDGQATQQRVGHTLTLLFEPARASVYTLGVRAPREAGPELCDGRTRH